MADPSDEIFVIDTSSLINVKEVIKPAKREQVFDELSKLCQQQKLVYPIEVLEELQNGVKPGRPDLPFYWARDNRSMGCRLGACHDELNTVMSNPVAKLTSDPDQTSGSDDADPHVLATALNLALNWYSPIVVTQESKKKPPLVPLNVAAGALNLPAINLYAFLLRIGVWTDDLTVSS